MVFPAIDALLPVNFFLPGHTIVVTDTLRSDGSFLLHHFINRFARLSASKSARKPNSTKAINSLKDDHSLPWALGILSFSQNAQHWRSVSRRLGWDLGKNLEQGGVKIFDGFGMLAGWPKQKGEMGAEGAAVSLEGLQLDESKRTSVEKGIFSWELPEDIEGDLRPLVDKVREAFNLPSEDISSDDDRPEPSLRLCLVLDDITALLDWGYSVSAILDFVSALRSLALSQNGAFILLAHSDTVALDPSAPLTIYSVPVSDEGSAMHSEQTALVQTLRHAADVAMDVVPLQSGASNDVHGQLDVTFSSLVGTKSVSYHYRVGDSTVEFHPVGLSRGII